EYATRIEPDSFDEASFLQGPTLSFHDELPLFEARRIAVKLASKFSLEAPCVVRLILVVHPRQREHSFEDIICEEKWSFVVEGKQTNNCEHLSTHSERF